MEIPGLRTNKTNCHANGDCSQWPSKHNVVAEYLLPDLLSSFTPPHSRALSRTRTHCVRGYMGEREKEVRNTYVLRQGVKEERSSNSMFSGVLATLLSLLSPQLLSPHVSPSFPQSGLLSPIYERLIGSLLSPSLLVSPGSRYCDPVRPLVRTDSISMSPCCDKVSTRA